jgi:hypothetical protein
VSIEQENGMEAFFMMTAMITLLGPIAVGRVRCIDITARLLELDLVKSLLACESAPAAPVAGNASSTARLSSAKPGSAALPAHATPAPRRQQSAFHRYADRWMHYPRTA